MLMSALALCLLCVLFTTKLSRQRAENVRCEVADAAGNRELKHGARQPEVGFLQPEVGFLHHWAVVLPKCSANRLYKTKDSSTILVALGMLNGKRYHFRLTNVAEKRLCLSSLMSYTSVRVFGSLLTVFW